MRKQVTTLQARNPDTFIITYFPPNPRLSSNQLALEYLVYIKAKIHTLRQRKYRGPS